MRCAQQGRYRPVPAEPRHGSPPIRNVARDITGAKERTDEEFRLYELACEEFLRDGKVTSAKCDKCGCLIDIQSLGDGFAWAMNCFCGKFKDTLRVD